MIQRIQTVYLTLALIFLSLGTFNKSWFTLTNETKIANFHPGGVDVSILSTGELESHAGYPFYIALIVLLLLTLATLLSFKKIELQQKLGRLNFVLYFITLLGLTVWSFLSNSILDEVFTERAFSFGYYAVVCGFPFVFLANTGIKRDKALLDSLNRIR